MKLLALSLALFLPTSVYALSDIEDYQYKSAVEFLETRGIIDGYEDGTFRPNKPINRAEFLKLLMLSVHGSQGYQITSAHCFTDFTANYQWFWSHACAAKELGIIHGYPDGTFRGEDTIILAEALKMSFEAWGVHLEKDDPTKPWYDRYMRAATVRNMFKRFPYTPGYQLTRGEMAQLLIMVGEPIAVVDPNIKLTDPTLVVVPKPIKNAVCGNGTLETGEQCDDGNKANGDGCSDICVVVAEPIRHGALRVEQQVISNAPQSSGNTDIPFMAFTAIAGRQDVYITTLKFRSSVGSLQYAENYRLFIDRDGDGKVESLYGRATANGETLTFANLNILVKDGQYMRVELWGDLDTTLTPGALALAFDTTQPDFIEGVDRVDGEDVTGIILNDGVCEQEDVCWIGVITIDDQEVSIGTQGNLYITEGSIPIGQRQIIASTQTESLMYINMRADAEDIVVKKLAFEGLTTAVDFLSLYKGSSTTPFTTVKKVHCAPVVSGRYCTNDDFTIEQNEDIDIAVKATLLSDTQGATSNQTINILLSSMTSGNTAGIAEGKSSGQRLEQNNGNAVGEGEVFIGTESPAANATIFAPEHTVVLAKISDIVNSNPDAENSPITGGANTIAQYSFTAANHDNGKDGYNTVELDTVKFTVSAVNTSLDSSGFYVFNTQDSSAITSCSANATTGTITVTCSGLIASGVNTVISRNGTLNLGLRATVSTPQISPGVSVLQVSLNNLSNPSSTGTIEWSDGVSTFDWVDIGKTQVKSTVYRLN